MGGGHAKFRSGEPGAIDATFSSDQQLGRIEGEPVQSAALVCQRSK
jgi:hypothetical protein